MIVIIQVVMVQGHNYATVNALVVGSIVARRNEIFNIFARVTRQKHSVEFYYINMQRLKKSTESREQK